MKLRTKATKGAGSKETAMAFKLLQECQKMWRRIRGDREEIQNLLMRLEYCDGIVVPLPPHQEAAAS